MNIDARKYHLIEQVMQCTEFELDRVEALFEEAKNEAQIEKDLTKRAEQSEKDISEGKVYTIEEADTRLRKRLGL
jgi:hypothetical protein